MKIYCASRGAKNLISGNACNFFFVVRCGTAQMFPFILAPALKWQGMNRPINHKSSSKLNLRRLITPDGIPKPDIPMDFHNQLRHKLIINDHCLATVMFKCQRTLETRNISVRLSERSFIAHFCMIYARTRCTLKFPIDRGPNECCIKSRNVCFLFRRAFVGAANVKCYSKQLKHYLRLRSEPRQMPLVIIIEEKPRKRRTYATEQQHFCGPQRLLLKKSRKALIYDAELSASA